MKISIFFIAFLLSFSPFFLLAQDNGKNDNFVQKINETNFKFWQEIRNISGKENILYSSYSISLAFGMLTEGLKGTTADEVINALLLPPNSEARQNAFENLNTNLLKNKKSTLQVANGIWLQYDFYVKPTYKNIVSEKYDAEVRNLNFKNEPIASTDTINKWVEIKTHKLIQNALPYSVINKFTRAVITNTIYFNDDWEFAFDSSLTQKQSFKNADSSINNVKMMQYQKPQKLKYYEAENLECVELPYKNGCSMWVFLPKEGTNKVLDSLNLKKITAYQSKSNTEEVIIHLPKFEYQKEYELKGLLGNMGINKIFGGGDFGNMIEQSETELDKLRVTNVIHKAKIEVNETGTKAAAFTAIIMAEVVSANPKPLPKIFRANRPFMFLIQDNATNTILFAGAIQHLTDNE